jgi:hypothetical protein
MSERERALVVTGRDLVINGVAELPCGLFGVHAAELSPERVADWGVEAVRLIQREPTGTPDTSPAPFVLDCLYDRYQAAVCLTRPDWDAHLRDLGRRYGAAAPVGQPGAHALEFWNEPYLNWAGNPGVNYDGGHYLGENPTAGEPMTTRVGRETIPADLLRAGRDDGCGVRPLLRRRADTQPGVPRARDPDDSHSVSGSHAGV